MALKFLDTYSELLVPIYCEIPNPPSTKGGRIYHDLLLKKGQNLINNLSTIVSMSPRIDPSSSAFENVKNVLALAYLVTHNKGLISTTPLTFPSIYNDLWERQIRSQVFYTIFDFWVQCVEYHSFTYLDLNDTNANKGGLIPPASYIAYLVSPQIKLSDLLEFNVSIPKIDISGNLNPSFYQGGSNGLGDLTIHKEYIQTTNFMHILGKLVALLDFKNGFISGSVNDVVTPDIKSVLTANRELENAFMTGFKEILSRFYATGSTPLVELAGTNPDV